MEEIVVKVDGREYKVVIEETHDGKILVHCQGDVYEVETKKDAAESAIERLQKRQSVEEGSSAVEAPLPGIVYEIKAKEGSHVKKGQSLMTLMAMKMENDITAPKDGVVREIKVRKDDSVNKGDVLAVIE